MEYNVLLDFKNADILQTDIVFSQGDYGHAAINISCRDGDETIKDAMSATIAFNTPNGNIVTGDLSGEAGEYKYTFKGSEFQAPGKITAAVSLKWADGRLSSCVFTFKCRAIPSGSEVPAGTYLTEVDKVVEEAKNKILELQDLIDKLQPGIGSTALTKADLQNDLLQDTPGIKALDAVQGSVIKKLIDDIKEQTPTGVVTEEALNNVLKSYIKSDQIINNLLATVAGNALDATQGKILNDKITQLNSELKAKEILLESDAAGIHCSVQRIGNVVVVIFSGWLKEKLNAGSNTNISWGNIPEKYRPTKEVITAIRTPVTNKAVQLIVQVNGGINFGWGYEPIEPASSDQIYAVITYPVVL